MARKQDKELELALYHITFRKPPADDEHYQEAIVAAYSITDAKETHPSGIDGVEWDDQDETWGEEDDDFVWVPPYDVVAEKVGLASSHVQPGVVMARFVDEVEPE